MKRWKVRGQLNMDASNYKEVEIKANSERKARILGEEKLKKQFKAFHVTNITVEQIVEGYDNLPKNGPLDEE